MRRIGRNQRRVDRFADQTVRARWARRALAAKLEATQGSAERAHETPSAASLAFRIAIVVLPLLAMLGWIWVLGAERRAIDAMPPEERAVVYTETLDAFATMCAPPRDGLFDHCRAQAAFLLKFDECDEDCRARVSPLLRWRSR
jgi:hypothetical protein